MALSLESKLLDKILYGQGKMPPRIEGRRRAQAIAGRDPNVRDEFGDAPRAPRVQNCRQEDDAFGRFLKMTLATWWENMILKRLIIG